MDFAERAERHEEISYGARTTSATCL